MPLPHSHSHTHQSHTSAALWRGSVVAVKTLVLPGSMSRAQKRGQMAIMEAAISSSLSHPNVVQVSGSVLCVCVAVCVAVEGSRFGGCG